MHASPKDATNATTASNAITAPALDSKEIFSRTEERKQARKTKRSPGSVPEVISPPREKAVKEPRPPKQQASARVKADHNESAVGPKAERSILSFFDRSNSGPPPSRPIATSQSEPLTSSATSKDDHHSDSITASATSPTKGGYKQSCLSFDVLDPSKADTYFASMLAASKDDDRRLGGILKELPPLTGRAPYEDLLDGMLLRSSKLPSLSKLELQPQELNMDMLADIKMVHEFLNTFGTPLGLTKDPGEWITFDLLLSMIRNPRIDNRLLDLLCRMIKTAYEDDDAPKIDQFNFLYFLAAGPETIALLAEQKETKKTKFSASSRKKALVPLNRLATIEYAVYTTADRVEALVKALHDITASDRFHRFMRNEVEENITTLKRHKRKRAEVRKELETQTHDLEREMKAIEVEAAELESQRQAILASERENAPAEEESGTLRITAAARRQRLAQAKDARTKAHDLLNQQKSLANDLKAIETTWESKKEELEDISLDDTEVQRDHNVPLTQLRGGHVINSDDKLRVICLGSDRWGRKYWFWREFGGVIVEDRALVGPKVEASDIAQEVSTSMTRMAVMDDRNENGALIDEDPVNDVTQRMKTMAEPDLAGDKSHAARDNRMSINNLLSEASPTEEAPPITIPQQPEPAKPTPEKDLLDYGPIQTWTLISTTKELASITRALNAKGSRERILKASLQTMRKEIEDSFDRIKTWAARDYVGKNDQVVSVMGAVGQLLSKTDLELLKKKRGRKSRQELADIAATELELEAAVLDKSMDLDHDPTSVANPDVEMDEDGSDHGQEQSSTLQEEEDQNEVAEGFLAAIRGEDSGSLPSEYFEGLVQTVAEKLKELSQAICNGRADAISEAVQEVSGKDEQRASDSLETTIRVLQRCLQLMGESSEEDGEDTVKDAAPDQEPSLPTVVDAADDTKTEQDTVMDDATSQPEEAKFQKLRVAVPVSVNPRLLAWLQTCQIDTMLMNVKTFGALYAWLDECKASIASAVYDTDEDDDEEEDVQRGRKKKQEDDDAEDDENEEDEGEGDDDDEGDQEDDEGEEAGDEKTQEDDQEDDEDEDENEGRRSRQRKTRQESRLRITTIRGRALRARTNRAVSYKDEIRDSDEEQVLSGEISGEDVDEGDEKADEMEEEEHEEESIASRLRRSKRTRH
ncbi:hypothetical protein BGZ99_008677 [Dissophora globulifera]|uniref:DDT domain-containing protein n=1 Tax=Dissophora globulifera TaxID=979702 RepID=A0A9P6RB84_9FUNG|nr:hypothetical protein BGZ99_008677 [Dissophora globulifera]